MGMRLMREVEEIQQKRMACLRSLRTGEKADLAVSYRVLAALFPEAPQQELEGLCAMRQYDPELPWNRRRRRALEKARGIVLHLYSGPGPTSGSGHAEPRHDGLSLGDCDGWQDHCVLGRSALQVGIGVSASSDGQWKMSEACEESTWSRKTGVQRQHGDGEASLCN